MGNNTIRSDVAKPIVNGDRAYSSYFLVNYQTGAIYTLGRRDIIKCPISVNYDEKHFINGILVDNWAFVS